MEQDLQEKQSERNSNINCHNYRNLKENDDETVKWDGKYKYHQLRSSLITDLMNSDRWKTFRNLCITFCIMQLICSVIFYVASPHIFWSHLSRAQWCVSETVACFKLWLGLNAYALMFHPGLRLWIALRCRLNKKLVDKMFFHLCVSFILLSFGVIPYAVFQNHLPVMSTFFVAFEHVRISTKIYSFVYESASFVSKSKPGEEGDSFEKMCPPLRNYVYFLFVPTFIYENSYPRTKVIRWRFVLANFLTFFASVFWYLFCGGFMLYQDVLSRAGLVPYSPTEVVLLCFWTLLMGTLLMLLVMLNLLHTWQNAFAELLRFGDRFIYEDWWNSVSMEQYLRKMNLPVYNFIRIYIYAEARRQRLSKRTSMMFIVVLSAIIHEYVLACALGSLCPVLFLTFALGTPILTAVRVKSERVANALILGAVFLGWGLFVGLYALEWYAKINCPRTLGTLDYFVPRMLTSTCKFIDYS